MAQQHSILTPIERREKQKLLLRDTVALCTLAGLVIALSFMTYGLFHSFATHRQMLQARWRARGEMALAAGQPEVALNDLHSALAYAPDDRGLQIELATALAASGRTQEALVYFTTLLEREPGSGLINLQLARVAIQQGNAQAAIDHYEAAIDGTWEGDAFTRRRDIRLELSRFLIAQKRYPEARSLLLITSGNGPDNHPLQLQLGEMLEAANDAADALDVYRKAASHRATRLQALEGEAHAAATLGRFAEAKGYLSQAMSEPGFARQPQAVRDAVRAQLETADGVLALDPGNTLDPKERVRRIAHAAQLAQTRLLGCPANAMNFIASSTTAAVPPPEATAPLATLGAHLQQFNPLAPKSVTPPLSTTLAPGGRTASDSLGMLTARWTALPASALLQRQLATDPIFAQNMLQLVYQTERDTAELCGAPTGEDALLLRIAQAPNQMGTQP